jgi:hypothetical protein
VDRKQAVSEDEAVNAALDTVRGAVGRSFGQEEVVLMTRVSSSQVASGRPASSFTNPDRGVRRAITILPWSLFGRRRE